MKLKYPVVIYKIDDYYNSECPDLGIITEGDTYQEAKMMIIDAIELTIASYVQDLKKPYPKPSKISSYEGKKTVLVEVDTEQYSKQSEGFLGFIKSIFA